MKANDVSTIRFILVALRMCANGSLQISWGNVPEIHQSPDPEWQLRFQNYDSNINRTLYCWTPWIYYSLFDNYRLLPRRGTKPLLAGSCVKNQIFSMATHTNRRCEILCIDHLTIRFPPRGRALLLLAQAVFTCYCSEQHRVSRATQSD